MPRTLPLGVLGHETEIGGAVVEETRRQQGFLARPLLCSHRYEEQHKDKDTGEDQDQHQPEVVIRFKDAGTSST